MDSTSPSSAFPQPAPAQPASPPSRRVAALRRAFGRPGDKAVAGSQSSSPGEPSGASPPKTRAKERAENGTLSRPRLPNFLSPRRNAAATSGVVAPPELSLPVRYQQWIDFDVRNLGSERLHVTFACDAPYPVPGQAFRVDVERVFSKEQEPLVVPEERRAAFLSALMRRAFPEFVDDAG